MTAPAGSTAPHRRLFRSRRWIIRPRFLGWGTPVYHPASPRYARWVSTGSSEMRGPRVQVRVGSIVVRCVRFDELLAFWQAALGYVPRYAPQDGWAILTDPTGAGPNVSLDRVAQHELPPLGETQPGASGPLHHRPASGGRAPAQPGCDSLRTRIRPRRRLRRPRRPGRQPLLRRRSGRRGVGPGQTRWFTLEDEEVMAAERSVEGTGPARPRRRPPGGLPELRAGGRPSRARAQGRSRRRAVRARPRFGVPTESV